LSLGHRRLAAIMFTDMVGYTALGQRNETLSLALVEEQRKVVRPILARHNGREIKTMGDAFLVEFPNAVDAVRCAYAIQRAVREFNFSLESDKRIHLRIGVHVGEVVESQGDISGDAVNVASRIEPLAEDGGVCVSSQIYDLVRGKVDLPLTSIGPKMLKNVAAPLEVFRMVMPWGDETAGAPARLDTRRIAVLPLANISPDSSDVYFADGLTEELISKLSLVKGLKVIARTSVMGYKNKDKKISEIGSELGVGTLVEGSVRKAGNKIRVTAQLIDVTSEEHLWASSYDKNIDDIFAVQSDVAEKIASSLSAIVLPQEKEKIEREPTRNPLAHENYLKGRYYMLQGSTDMHLKALDHLTEAINQDNEFTEAHALLAHVYGLLGSVGFFPPKEAYDKASREAGIALGLNDKLPESHVAMGAAHFMGLSWKHTIEDVDRALTLSPENADARCMRGYALMFQGRLSEAIVDLRKAEDIDPMNEVVLGGLAIALLRNDDHPGSERAALRCVEFSPESLNSISTLAYNALSRGEKDEAVRLYERLEKLGGQNWAGYLGYGYAKVDRREDALKVLEDLRKKSELAYIAPTIPAMVCAGLGDKDDAFQWLDKALEVGDPQLGFLGIDYVWFDLRTDPRFEPMVSKISSM